MVVPGGSPALGWAPIPPPSGHTIAQHLDKGDKRACRILIGHAAELPGTHRANRRREKCFMQVMPGYRIRFQMVEHSCT